MLTTTHLPPCKCPCCGDELSAATSSDPRDPPEAQRPRPGMVSICASCCQVLIFNDDLTQRAPTDAELADIMAGDAGKKLRMLACMLLDAAGERRWRQRHGGGN